MGAPGQPNPIARENGLLGGRPVSESKLAQQRIRERLVKRFEEKADQYFDALEKAAFGSGRDKPQVEAAKIMLEQCIGKPKQSIEGEIEHKGVVKLEELTEIFRTRLDSDKKDV